MLFEECLPKLSWLLKGAVTPSTTTAVTYVFLVLCAVVHELADDFDDFAENVESA